MKKINLIASLLILAVTFISSTSFAQKRDFYELRTYHIESGEQEAMLDHYFENALIPAAHRQGVSKVGVFKPIAGQPNEGKEVYLFLPFKNMNDFVALEGKLAKDQAYQTAGSAYINASHTNPPYKRIESSLLQAMSGQPKFAESNLTNAKKDRVYELRSYEAATERLYQAKVKMFNSGEMDIFEKLNCSPIFYGETIAGANMPNLWYMTTHENMDIRNEHWDQFRVDPDWEAMKDLPEYANTVSHADVLLLYPAEYSDL
ncbi:NIPSNAP family protein [Algoriphagus halophytocola]|uniref:NIPSNAP family protein n=1 Tax=Algoriphagus halophytocola TaxID=2991499 RepID=A0ABY6MDD9_9BACT|nr:MULTISPECIES: NIPSNAP family protein [unclassified Algoriphagus]UZD21735.1 NIPSNAP family protein [Algoriphagus sp. TR-M5]WBL42947.1 NIPSNAP family protein [Algoriphagus sp. TR-M9]